MWLVPQGSFRLWRAHSSIRASDWSHGGHACCTVTVTSRRSDGLTAVNRAEKLVMEHSGRTPEQSRQEVVSIVRKDTSSVQLDMTSLCTRPSQSVVFAARAFAGLHLQPASAQALLLLLHV